MEITVNRVEAIRVMMKRKNINMNELADRLGVSRQAVSATLSKPDMRKATFERYAKALGIETVTVVKDKSAET